MNTGEIHGLSVANGEISSRSDLRLTARYRWLLLAVVLPLFIVIMVLALNQYRDQRAQVLRGLAQSTFSYSIALDGIAKLASDHVLQMQAWSENYLRSPPSYPSDLRAYFTPRIVNGTPDSYTLDEVPEEKRKDIGQLAWLGGDPRQPGVGDVASGSGPGVFLTRPSHARCHPVFSVVLLLFGRQWFSSRLPMVQCR
ncbi:MAG: hypothetical protein WCH04_16365 [Gammaproteobacteria bacterium]